MLYESRDNDIRRYHYLSTFNNRKLFIFLILENKNEHRNTEFLFLSDSHLEDLINAHEIFNINTPTRI